MNLSIREAKGEFIGQKALIRRKNVLQTRKFLNRASVGEDGDLRLTVD